MALTNCSINSTSEVVPQDQGNIISQVLYITPDDGYLISAVDLSVADKSYTDNSSSLEFVNGTNGVVLDIAINSITLSNTTNVGATDNKVKVIVDFENGYTMPGADTVLTIDIDGEAISDNLIDLRAVLLIEGVTQFYDVFSVTGASNITHLEVDGGVDSLGVPYSDRFYFSTNQSVEPGVQIKLATIAIHIDNGVGPNHTMSPEPSLSSAGSGFDKFEIANVQATYDVNNLLKVYTFDLMFTDDIDLSANPWGDYSSTGEYYGNTTVRLEVKTTEVYIPVENSGIIDAITTNVTQTVYCDPLEVPSCI
tara:strand:+ start:4846 stop:5772 length:927 start_codon:yes stop_codon:yes gene_type:complete